MRIAAFEALRPPKALVEQVSSPPYDVIDEEEARRIAAVNPLSFLHVTRAEVDLPRGVSPYDDGVYAKAAENFLRFQREGILLRDKEPCLYVYRQTTNTHQQTGIVSLCHIDDYIENRIRKHENTLKAKREDRARHIRALSADAEPVFLFYPSNQTISALLLKETDDEPLYDFLSEDGVQHQLWLVKDRRFLIQAFRAVEVCHIADGHHRAAASVEVGLARRAETANIEDGANWFLAVLFASSELRILPYNRCVRDLGGLSADAFLDAVRRRFQVIPKADPEPKRRGIISMYLAGNWFGLVCPAVGGDLVTSLDVSILQDQLLGPVLGIQDPTRDSRLEFVGGRNSITELTRRVDAGQCAVAFSLYAVSVDDVMAVADSGRIMPPKSTWFDPKLRSGLFAYVFDHTK